MATIVLGSQFGDEGKGKLVDILCASAHICARSAGGNNAGHTIVTGGVTYDFHILPSGLVNPECMNLIGSGVVVHVPSFFKELEDLKQKGLNTDGRIFISDRAQIVFDLHQIVDGLEELELGKSAVGTTKKGIGPSYSSKSARNGARISEIFDKENFDRKLRTLAASCKKRYSDLLQYDVDAEIARFDEYRERLADFVIDAVPFIHSAQSSPNTNILVEGANALMLDIDYGTYPYVTSSNTGIGGVFTGLALNPFKIKEIIGVVKAYTTRVGGGPLPTEQLNSDGEKLQSVGREFGVTTGRKRRCGWLDLPMLAYSTTINHYTSLNLTKLDILDSFPTIPIAVAYHINSKPLDSFPADLALLSQAEIIYETLPGWEKPCTGAKTYYDLPINARKFVDFVEGFVGVQVKYIGTGPAREDMIVRPDRKVEKAARERLLRVDGEVSK